MDFISITIAILIDDLLITVHWTNLLALVLKVRSGYCLV
jgi:hypothetical protein